MIVGLYVAMGTGTSYAFGIYSGALKESFGFTQSQLDSIPSFASLVGLLSPLGGMLSDRWGSRAACLIAACFAGMGFALFYAIALEMGKPTVLALANSLGTTTPVIYCPLMAVLLGTALFGGAVATGAVFSSAVRNYSGQKGLVVGLMKTFVGIGAGVFTQLYSGFVGKPSSSVESGLNFLLYLALATLTMNGVSSLALSTFPEPSSKGLDKVLQLRLLMVYVVLLVLLFTVASVGIVQHLLDNTGSLVASCVVLVILLSPFVSLLFDIFFGSTQMESADKDLNRVLNGSITQKILELPVEDGVTGEAEDSDYSRTNQQQDLDADESVSRESSADAESQQSGNCTGKIYPLGRDVNLWGMLRTPEAWMILVSFSINMGSGYMVITNVSQMAASLSLAPSVVSTAVTLLSCGNGLGRLLTGLGSDILLGHFKVGTRVIQRPVCFGKRRTFPRPIWMAFALIVGTLGHTVMVVGAQTGHGGGQAALFWFGSTLIGVGFGSTFPLEVVITAELFGNKNVGANFMFFDGFCALVAAMLFGKFIPQTVYESHSHDGGLTCLGPECFLFAHLIQIACNVVALVLILIVVKRTFGLYQNSQSKH